MLKILVSINSNEKDRWNAHLREHNVEWDSKFLGEVDMGKSGRIGNDDVGYKRSRPFTWSNKGGTDASSVIQLVATCHAATAYTILRRLNARFPTALQNLVNADSALPYIAISQCLEARHESGVLHHEGHKLSGVATNVKKLQAIVFYEALEGSMGSQAYAVAIFVL
jgi:hypothetical protein